MPISRNAAATSSQLFDGGILAFAIALLSFLPLIQFVNSLYLFCLFFVKKIQAS